MINQVAPRTRISAEKMNKVITAVNTNTELLNKSNLTPVKALNGKAFAPEMFFNISPSMAAFESANPDFSLESGTTQNTGAIMYTGGIDNILNMVTIDGKPLDYFFQTIPTEESIVLEHLSANFDETKNEFGPNVVIKGFHYNNNEDLNTIKVGIGTAFKDSQIKNVAVIHVDNLPYEDPSENLAKYFKIDEGTYFEINQWHTIFTRNKFKNNLNLDAYRPNQSFIGQLNVKTKDYMFLDAEKHLVGLDEDRQTLKYCWKVYVDNKLSDGSRAPYGFYNVFNGDIWPSYNIYGSWLILEEHPITTPLYCGFTLPENPNGSKYKKIVFGTFSDLAPSASGSPDLPYFTQGSSESGELYPDLVPILIADYDSSTDKVKQYFHGLLVDTFPIPDSRDPNWIGSVNDGYRGVGKSLDWVHIISSPWEQANLLELYNFSKESTFSGGEDCDEYEVTIKNSDGTDFEPGSSNKTVLMRGDNSHELKYGKLVISKDALSSLINSDPDEDEDDPYRPPHTEDDEGCTDEMKSSGYGYYVWSACDERWMPAYGAGSVADGLYWKQGGNHGTNYGATIGDVNGQAVIYLTNKILRGDWKVDGKYQIMNNILYITNGADMGMNTAYFQLDNAFYGPKVITDGNGDSVTVLAKLN